MLKCDVMAGDVRESLKRIPDGSVHCCVTSPPYLGLRSYLPKGHPDKHREIGQEATPDLFVQTMVEVFREVRRCLHESGTLWLNLGDTYNGYMANQRGTSLEECRQESRPFFDPGTGLRTDGLKPKDLCLIPERAVLALQGDGWWVRSKIVWHKRSCMPESVTDRPTNSWEPIFLLAKSQRYFYDAEAVKEKQTESSAERAQYGWNGNTDDGSNGARTGSSFKRMAESGEGMATIPADGMRNQRNVWSLGPEPYSEAHFATFPTEIPRRAILAGTSARGCCPKCGEPWVRVVEKGLTAHDGDTASAYEKGSTANRLAKLRQAARERGGEYSNESRTVGWEAGCECHFGVMRQKGQLEYEPEPPIPCTVLDPFGGSGTTGAVALELGRRAILCELNPDYLELIGQRTHVTPGLQLA